MTAPGSKITVMGDSHVRRLQGTLPNNEHHFSFLSEGGAKADTITNPHHPHNHLLQELARSPPKFLVLILGGNDITSKSSSVRRTIERFEDLLKTIHRQCPDTFVIVIQIPFRSFFRKYVTTTREKEAINHHISLLNSGLKQLAKCRDHVYFYKVSGFGEGIFSNNFLGDGVHLSKEGYAHLSHNIIKAIRKAVTETQTKCKK